MAAFLTAPMFLLDSSHTNNMFLDCIGNLHFLETDAEVDVVPVRVSEAEPVAAVPLLPEGELLTVIVLAAPSENEDLMVLTLIIHHASIHYGQKKAFPLFSTKESRILECERI